VGFVKVSTATELGSEVYLTSNTGKHRLSAGGISRIRAISDAVSAGATGGLSGLTRLSRNIAASGLLLVVVGGVIGG